MATECDRQRVRDEAIASYATWCVDLKLAVKKAEPNPLALDSSWTNLTMPLVEAGVAKIVDVGSRVFSLDTGQKGTIVAKADSNTELLVQFDGGRFYTFGAGKKESCWELGTFW